jgi:hypothetical protein
MEFACVTQCGGGTSTRFETVRRQGRTNPIRIRDASRGCRRRAITGIKLLHGKCIACDGKATRVFMAFQARICGRCCCRLLISDAELAWRYGLPDPPGNPPYIVRYLGHTRVRFFMRQHLTGAKLKQKPLTRERLLDCMRRWPGVGSREVCGLLDRMA